jgi:hypothetical protein
VAQIAGRLASCRSTLCGDGSRTSSERAATASLAVIIMGRTSRFAQQLSSSPCCRLADAESRSLALGHHVEPGNLLIVQAGEKGRELLADRPDELQYGIRPLPRRRQASRRRQPVV